MKEVFAPHLSRNVKFGRARPKVRPQVLKFSNYLRLSLPTAPLTSDYSSAALPVLRDVMGNDQYGDCVLAAAGHLVGTATGNAGDLFHCTLSQVLAMYTAITGFDPNNPATDQGTNITDALDYLVKVGFPNGTKALGYVKLDVSNVAEMKAAIWLFEHTIYGIELPDTYTSPMPSGDGFVWDTGTPDPQQGHCFLAFGYEDLGSNIDTWGIFGTFTWPAITELCSDANGGEAYLLLTPDILTKGQTKAPNGVDWSALVADFDSLGANVPIPSPPAPIPSPVPAPPGTAVTLAQAQAWANVGLAAAHPLLMRSQAESIVKAALAKNWPKP